MTVCDKVGVVWMSRLLSYDKSQSSLVDEARAEGIYDN